MRNQARFFVIALLLSTKTLGETVTPAQTRPSTVIVAQMKRATQIFMTYGSTASFLVRRLLHQSFVNVTRPESSRATLIRATIQLSTGSAGSGERA